MRWNGVLQSPSVIVSSHLWLFLSFSLISLVPLSLSLARALAHALGLVTSRVLEDTIDTPTGSNGVLPSLCVSLSLSVFFSFCYLGFNKVHDYGYLMVMYVAILAQWHHPPLAAAVGPAPHRRRALLAAR